MLRVGTQPNPVYNSDGLSAKVCSLTKNNPPTNLTPELMYKNTMNTDEHKSTFSRCFFCGKQSQFTILEWSFCAYWVVEFEHIFLVKALNYSRWISSSEVIKKKCNNQRDENYVQTYWFNQDIFHVSLRPVTSVKLRTLFACRCHELMRNSNANSELWQSNNKSDFFAVIRSHDQCILSTLRNKRFSCLKWKENSSWESIVRTFRCKEKCKRGIIRRNTFSFVLYFESNKT